MNANLSKVIQVVSAVIGEPEDDILHGGRAWRYVWPRSICMAILREEVGMSFPAISADFGQSHSNAIYALRIVHDEITTNTARRREYDKCLLLFKASAEHSAPIPQTAAHHD